MHGKIRSISRTLEEYATLVCSFLINSVFYRRRNLSQANIQRIAIVKLDHIGDIILSMPAIANLKAHFPNAHITMIVNSALREVAGYIPDIDEIVKYDARFFDRSGKSRMFDFGRGISFARDMRRREFDLIVDLRGSFATLAFALIAQSEYRVDRATYLIERKIGRISDALEHEADVNLDLLVRSGISIYSRDISLILREKDIASAGLLLPNCSESPFVVIHPGPSVALKCWPADRYTRLICELQKRYKAYVALVGGRGEEQITHSIASATDNKVIDLSGKTTLGQLSAILQRADIFIGNDSGPMHLAAACGTKVIGLFGPTSPQRFGPYGKNCIALRMESDCPPCMREKCNIPGRRCIDKISVDDVMATVEQITQ